jgi:hypothetical protein
MIRGRLSHDGGYCSKIHTREGDGQRNQEERGRQKEEKKEKNQTLKEEENRQQHI